MDTGLAALLGASIGSLTTLGAAVVSGRAQARAQHAQWRRQHRRDAYAAYLSALHDRDVAMDAILDELRSHRPDLPEVDEKVRRFIALAREVHRAMEVVIMEGPPSVAEAADRVAQASGDLSEVMRRMVRKAHAADATDMAQDRAAASERERSLYKAVADFRTRARETLDRAR